MLLLRCMSRNKAQYTFPCISRGLGKLCCSAVKEAMRRTWIDHDLVLHTGFVERLIEGLHLLGRNTRVCSTEEIENGIFDVPGNIKGSSPLFIQFPAQSGIEA